MLSIILMVGVTMAGELIPAEDHLECTEPQAGVEMQCWPAQRGHDSLDLCVQSHDLTFSDGTHINDVLHVHVRQAETVTSVDRAPWSEPEPEVEPVGSSDPTARSHDRAEPDRESTGTVTVRVRSGERHPGYAHRDGSSRPPRSRPPGVYSGSGVRVVTQPVYVSYEPVHYGGHTGTFQASETALGDWQAINEDWVAGVRAENQAYENEAREADERARKAETARKAEEAKRLAAQARAVKAEESLEEADGIIQDLLSETTTEEE